MSRWNGSRPPTVRHTRAREAAGRRACTRADGRGAAGAAGGRGPDRPGGIHQSAAGADRVDYFAVGESACLSVHGPSGQIRASARRRGLPAVRTLRSVAVAATVRAHGRQDQPSAPLHGDPAHEQEGDTGMAPVVTMRQLLESGVHFGHQTRRWNPKMKRFILAERNGIYIIDLQQSLDFIDKAYEFIRETVAHGGTVLYVGTKKQAQEAIADQARRVGMEYVNQRWLGGMLTNFSTVHKRLQRLKELEEIDFEDVAGSGMTKKELLHLRRERDKLDRSLGGIKDMARVPSALWVVDTKKEHLAVSEARQLGIPVIAVLDTNCDPDEVDYPIPGNDDAIRSVSLLTRVVADAVADGLMARGGEADGEDKPSPAGELGAEEPLAEWERELLEHKRPEDGGAAGPA